MMKLNFTGALIKLVTLTTTAMLLSSSNAQTVVFDDFEHGDPIFVGWFAFGSAIGGGGIDPNGADLAPIPNNAVGMQTGWGSGAGPGFWGGFGWENPIDIGETDTFSMWINPDADQDYILEINIQEDDNADGMIDSNDDEFQFNCAVSATGPCAITGGGWQKIEIPLTDFFDDNSFLTGGDGILNAQSPANGGNGELITMVISVVSNSPAAVTFRTDQWQFETTAVGDTDGDGVADDVDNCLLVVNPGQDDADADGFGTRCDADFNNDCVANFLDLSLFANEFLGSNPVFDLDLSGAVNFLDLSIFANSFLTQPGPSAQASCGD